MYSHAINVSSYSAVDLGACTCSTNNMISYHSTIFQLYNVNSSGDPEESIYGIMFEKFPATPKSDRKYFIVVSTLRYVTLICNLLAYVRA